METLIFLLACFGLTFIVTDAKIIEKPRKWIKSKSSILDYLLSCYFCTSIWSASKLLTLQHFYPDVAHYVNYTLAGATVTYFLSLIQDRLDF